MSRAEIQRKLSQSAEDLSTALHNIQRFRNTQIIFIALFTSVLAFFLLVISVIEIETQPEKRILQKINSVLYQELLQQKRNEGLQWLNIENTVLKGVRLTIAKSEFRDQQLFFSARARVNPYFVPYVNRIVDVIKAVDLPGFQERYASLVNKIVDADERFVLTVRVEGHTDARPLSKTALYQSNIELSSFRAYAIMELIRLYTQLPASQFSIAGYGSFRPITEDPNDSINRRVEIYIHPQIELKEQTNASST